MQCPRCGSMVNDQINVCMNCGEIIQFQMTDGKKGKKKTIWIVILSILAVMIVGVLGYKFLIPPTPEQTAVRYMEAFFNADLATMEKYHVYDFAEEVRKSGNYTFRDETYRTADECLEARMDYVQQIHKEMHGSYRLSCKSVASMKRSAPISAEQYNEMHTVLSYAQCVGYSDYKLVKVDLKIRSMGGSNVETYLVYLVKDGNRWKVAGHFGIYDYVLYNYQLGQR